nr:reverse transcriptase domain-containing protein [Tanacetum cinerariifolium]
GMVRRPPPESVDSYDDLKEAFLANFRQHKKCIKDPVEIHHIKQREGESTKDFVESRDVKGAPEVMRISGFMHGITNPKLIRRLHDKIPKSVDEMMRITTFLLRGEVAADNQEQKKSLTPLRSPSPYNETIGRPGVMKIQAVPSTAHEMLKFHVEGGILTLKSSKIIPIECAVVIRPEGQPLSVKQTVEERIKVAINPEYPERTIMIGSTLLEEGRDKLFRQKKRRQAVNMNQAIQEEVEKLVDVGIMKEVHYRSWLPNPVMVKKHDGSWRMCVDFKELNKACPKDGYPLLKIDWKVESLCGFPFKCFLDAYKGYHQIKMEKEDKEKTAFITSQGIFCYSKMPFCLRNAGATYQRLVDKEFHKKIGKILEQAFEKILQSTPDYSGHGPTHKANFIVERPKENSPNTLMEVEEELSEPWILFTDGSFEETNNEAKYEALIAGLRIAEQMRVKNLQANVDSRLMANQEVHYRSWLSNPVMVKKHDGSWRMCVDFKELNKACPKDGYPLLKIDWKVESLCGFPFKCFLDAHKGYHQIKMEKEDEEKTAFITSQGIICYSKMPFCLRNAGATYQRLVDKAFHKKIGKILESCLEGSRSQLHINEKNCLDTGPCQQAFEKILQSTPDYSGHGPTHKANFIVERLEENSPNTLMEVEEELSEPWILFTDGSSYMDGFRAGLILTNLEGTEFTYALRFRFEETNNEAKYEALIAGLRIAEQMGVKNLQANVDLRLMANQDLSPEGPGKVKFLIVAIDYFTKWIEVKPVVTITSNQVKNFMWDNIVCKFGLQEKVSLITENSFGTTHSKTGAKSYVSTNISLP